MIHNELCKDTSSRSVIDVAIGVLVGLRRCSERQAFDHRSEVVRRWGALVTGRSGAREPVV
jgi:hypothetical protein